MEPDTQPAPPLPFGLDKVKSLLLSPSEQTILAIFGDALRPRDADDDGASARAARASATANAIDALCPSIKDTFESYEASKPAEAFLWELWGMLLDISRFVPHDAEHPGQATMVGILDALRQVPRGPLRIWGAKTQLWQNLPYFSIRMDEDNSVGPNAITKDMSEETVQKWRNQSAFAARCLAAGLADWHDRAVYAMQDALEEEPKQEQDGDASLLTPDRRCVILGATEWIVHCGLKLLKMAQNSDSFRNIRADYQCYGDEKMPPGSLFRAKVPEARAGLSVARWTFWRERFEALLQPGRGLPEDVRAAVVQAVERMAQAETESAEQAAEEVRKREMQVAAEEEEAKVANKEAAKQAVKGETTEETKEEVNDEKEGGNDKEDSEERE